MASAHSAAEAAVAAGVAEKAEIEAALASATTDCSEAQQGLQDLTAQVEQLRSEHAATLEGQLALARAQAVDEQSTLRSELSEVRSGRPAQLTSTRVAQLTTWPDGALCWAGARGGEGAVRAAGGEDAPARDGGGAERGLGGERGGPGGEVAGEGGAAARRDGGAGRAAGAAGVVRQAFPLFAVGCG
jgi:hypothetical protein